MKKLKTLTLAALIGLTGIATEGLSQKYKSTYKKKKYNYQYGGSFSLGVNPDKQVSCATVGADIYIRNGFYFSPKVFLKDMFKEYSEVSVEKSEGLTTAGTIVPTYITETKYSDFSINRFGSIDFMFRAPKKHFMVEAGVVIGQKNEEGHKYYLEEIMFHGELAAIKTNNYPFGVERNITLGGNIGAGIVFDRGSVGVYLSGIGSQQKSLNLVARAKF